MSTKITTVYNGVIFIQQGLSSLIVLRADQREALIKALQEPDKEHVI